jgi:glucose/arabinose dehydrogenase
MKLYSPARYALFLLVLLLACRPQPLQAADLHPFVLPDGFTQDVLARDLGPATSFAIRPDGSILIARKHGSVKVYRDGKILEAPFLDISGETNNYGDRGLMGIAIHPDYPAAPYVYLAYTYEPAAAIAHEESGARSARVIRVEIDSRNPDKARAGSTVVLLSANGAPDDAGNLDRGDRPPYSCMGGDGTASGVPMEDCLPVDGPSHTVDGLVFGPDGALYVSAGDGTLQPDLSVRAQNLDSLAGKILRINPMTGAGYADNPYYDGDLSSNRSRVYALGLRNPYRFSFDPSGQLVVGDVGGERWEEINRGEAGANFGWPCLEGPLPNSGDPACAGVLAGSVPTVAAWHSYSHAGGYSAAIGGDFYTGSQYPPAYHGAYFYADHNRAALLYLPAGAAGETQAEVFATNVVAPVQISMGPDGALYVLSFVDGALSRIRYTGDGSTPAAVAAAGDASELPDSTEAPAAAASAAADASAAASAVASVAEVPVAEASPSVQILAPPDGSRWPANAEVALRGIATDTNGVELGGAALTWTATLHHNDHVHPDFFHGEGAAGTFRFEPHAPNIHYEICLTATEAAGKSAISCVDIYQSADLDGAGAADSTASAADQPDPLSVASETGVTVPGAAASESAGGARGVSRQLWRNLDGATIAALTGQPDYPESPDQVDTVSALESSGEGKDYGARLTAYVTAPRDGDYRFWIAADDSGELWLSTDDDPAHAVRIAYTETWTPKHAWDKSPTQASAPIPLQKGKRYYIEVRHKQADQKDNVAVAWQPPGSERVLIPGDYLAPN